MFAAYWKQDRGAADGLLADDFTFTSPNDDHIDKAAFLERCFPTADRFLSYDLVHVVPADRDAVFVMYEYRLQRGDVYRNTEVLTVRDGRIAETQVFFGGRVAG